MAKLQKRLKSKRPCKRHLLYQKKQRNETILTKLQKDQSTGKVRMCFGSRKLFREQYHLEENRFQSHEEWLHEWRIKRNSSFFLMGDAIMALFPSRADDALKAGMEIFGALEKFNKKEMISRNRSPIRVGVGINTGLSFIGTVGSKKRLDDTVLSDAVNTASRIEELNKLYGTTMLAGDETIQALNNPEDYLLRKIDRVRVKGKNMPQQFGKYLIHTHKEKRKR